jgi:hypothetical protein
MIHGFFFSRRDVTCSYDVHCIRDNRYSLDCSKLVVISPFRFELDRVCVDWIGFCEKV